MNFALVALALVAVASAQYQVNYQFNVSDTACGNAPNAIFANLAASNTASGAACLQVGSSSQYSRKVCNPTAGSKSSIEYTFSDSQCTQGTGSTTSPLPQTCFLFNGSAAQQTYSVPEAVDCLSSYPILGGTGSFPSTSAVVFFFYIDSSCNNLYGVYSYKAGQCQIGEGGYRFTLTSTGFTYLNYTDLVCNVQNGVQSASFGSDGACRQLTNAQTGFAPTVYYRSSSNSNGVFGGTNGSPPSGAIPTSGSNSGITVITAGSTTSPRGNSAASVVANLALVAVAAVAVMMS